MRVEVAFLPSLLHSVDNKLCIAVDALRASASMITLLTKGCDAVVPTCDHRDALAIKEGLTRKLSQRVLLCGEDTIGQLSEGFDLYNSPSQLDKSSYKGSIVIMNSTSGTRLIHSLSKAPILLVACALNARACARIATEEVKSLGIDIAIVCSGSSRNTRVAMEDIICAGLILDRIINKTEVELCDSGKVALQFYKSHENLKTVFRESDTGQRLWSAGEQQDIEYCSQVDITRTVPAKDLPLCKNKDNSLIFLRSVR